jgi:hypothetical protein
MSFDLSTIHKMIYVIRGQKVMLDSDLAHLYGVETKRLNEQVKRNIDRFPSDFMFQLNEVEYDNMRSQNATSSLEYGGRRHSPYVFSENGVAMLSSVLKSKQAIHVNIAIMRIFTKLRSFYMLEKDLVNQMNELKSNTNKMFKVVFERLDEIEVSSPASLPKTRKKIGLK